MRLPYAARTLIEQVTDKKPRTKAEPFGDLDGFGVARTIRFNKATGTWLAPLLDEIRDPRIQEHHLTGGGYLHVTFVADRRADDKSEFPLDAAETIVTS